LCVVINKWAIFRVSNNQRSTAIFFHLAPCIAFRLAMGPRRKHKEDYVQEEASF
jgi:hypothetical protein